MTVPSIMAALAAGCAVGGLGGLLVRGRHPVPAWVLLAAGVAGALAGAMIVRLVGMEASRLGIAEVGIQVVAAGLAVVGAAGRPRGAGR